LVIFCVALVEAMRTRMSFSEAILQFTPAIRSSIRPRAPLSSGPAVAPGRDGKIKQTLWYIPRPRP
jgi:hypothetical protein